MEKKIRIPETIMASVIFLSPLIGYTSYAATFIIIVGVWLMFDSKYLRDVIRIVLSVFAIQFVFTGIWSLWYGICDFLNATTGNKLFIFTQNVHDIINICFDLLWVVLGISELLGKKIRVVAFEKWSTSETVEIQNTKCPNCNAEIDENMTFCRSCGFKLK